MSLLKTQDIRIPGQEQITSAVFGTTFWNFGSPLLFNFELVWLYNYFDLNVTDEPCVDETRVYRTKLEFTFDKYQHCTNMQFVLIDLFKAGVAYSVAATKCIVGCTTEHATNIAPFRVHEITSFVYPDLCINGYMTVKS